jgi:hypothetical protein
MEFTARREFTDSLKQFGGGINSPDLPRAESAEFAEKEPIVARGGSVNSSIRRD